MEKWLISMKNELFLPPKQDFYFFWVNPFFCGIENRYKQKGLLL
jgi:hypothetical protein